MTLSDLGSIYGIDVYQLKRDDPEAFVGLWLNRYRGIARQSLPVRQGVRSAASVIMGPMRRDFYDHVSETADESQFLYEIDAK